MAKYSYGCSLPLLRIQHRRQTNGLKMLNVGKVQAINLTRVCGFTFWQSKWQFSRVFSSKVHLQFTIFFIESCIEFAARWICHPWKYFLCPDGTLFFHFQFLFFSKPKKRFSETLKNCSKIWKIKKTALSGHIKYVQE